MTMLSSITTAVSTMLLGATLAGPSTPNPVASMNHQVRSVNKAVGKNGDFMRICKTVRCSPEQRAELRAIGADFRADVDGESLRIDADGDGQLETLVEGDKGFVVLEHGDRRYGVSLVKQGEWRFVVGSVVQGELAGTAVYQFTLVPRPNAAVVWGKVVVTVRQADLLPVGQVFHDEDGEAVKSLSFTDFRESGGRTVPSHMKMLPLDEPGESTEISYELLDFDVALQDDFFSIQSLRAM